MDKITMIVNGAAGGGRCAKNAKAILEQWDHEELDLTWCETQSAGHGTELAREAYQAGCRHFIAVGGDGTVFEIINGLFPEALQGEGVTLGVLPMGTGNSMIRDFGVTSPEVTLEAIKRGASKPCDVVRVAHLDGEFFFVNLLSVGFSAKAGALMNNRSKAFGALGYVLGVVGSLARLAQPRFPMTVDGGEGADSRPCTLLSFSNSTYTGGTMMMAPNADMSDGLVDIIRIGEMGRVRLLRAFPRIFKGTHIHMPEVECLKAQTVQFDLQEDADVMVDGEILRLQLTDLEVISGALRIFS